jgi:hypothetical protein
MASWSKGRRQASQPAFHTHRLDFIERSISPLGDNVRFEEHQVVVDRCFGPTDFRVTQLKLLEVTQASATVIIVTRL